VRVSDRVVVSWAAPVSHGGGCPEGATLQARRCFESIAVGLVEAGATMETVVLTRAYLTSVSDFEMVAAVHAEVFNGVGPEAAMIVVTRMLDDRWKVEIEVEAILES
jgi:enamine deaminase RidA (YjgF/YER057c/UK114 family)